MGNEITELTEQARSGVRSVPWQKVAAGAGGASALALLTVAGFSPIITAVATGALSLVQVQSWLSNLGVNALSGWVAAWAAAATTEALSDNERAIDLDQRAAADPAIVDALARLLVTIDAIPQSLNAVAQEVGAQSDVLLAQHQLLQRIAGDVERQKFYTPELRRLTNEVLPAQADRVIGAVMEAVTETVDTMAATILAELRALRDTLGARVELRTEGQAAIGLSAGAHTHAMVDNRFLLPATTPGPGVPAALALATPAAFPAVSRVPSRNPNFVGRQDDLRWLAEALGGKSGARGIPGAAITGLAGLGKTDLATEFVHQYGQLFAGGVFVLSATRPDVLTAEIATCGRTRYLGRYPADTDLGLEEQVDQVLTAWREPIPRLLVLDACEDEALLRHLRDRLSGGGCRILVTSQRGTWSKSLGLVVRPLDTLERAESIKLLTAHRPDLAGHAALGEIADELGYLPLALHLAGSFLETYGDNPTLGDPDHFLAELRDQQLLGHDALRGVDVTEAPTWHDLHVARTFALCLSRLDASNSPDELACTLLERASFLAPGETIPWRLLLAMANVRSGNQTDERQVERAIRRLLSLGLVTRAEEGGMRLHRLLAVFMQCSATTPDAGKTAEQAVLIASDALNQLTAPVLLPPIQPHLRHVVQAAATRQDAGFARLLASLGEHLFLLGSTREALDVYQKVQTLAEAVHGPTDVDTLRARDRVALLLKELAKFDTAHRISTESLARRESLPAVDPAEIAENHHLIADVLVGRGDYDDARLHYEQALALRTACLGEVHHLTLTTLTSLSTLLCQIDPPAAEVLFARARESEQRLLAEPAGDMLVGVAIMRAMFLALLRKDVDTGERLLKHAQELYQHMILVNDQSVPRELRQLLAVSQQPRTDNGDDLEDFLVRIFGEHHPRTALSLMVLAAVHQMAGELADARRLYDRALAIQRQLRRGGRLETAQLIWWRGILLAQTGQRDAARVQLRRAFTIYTRVVGTGHPTTRRCGIDLHRLDQQPRGKHYGLKHHRSRRRRASRSRGRR